MPRKRIRQLVLASPEDSGKGLKILNIQRVDNLNQCPGLVFGTLFRIKVEGFGTIQTNLIGIEEGLHLIIKTPPIPEIGTKLFQKNNIVIHYLFAGQVFGFRTTLLGLINEPFRFAILAYPTKVEKINIRKHERICCMLPAKIKMSKDSYGILIEDISVGGCYFSVNPPKDGKFPVMRIGEETLLMLTLPGITDSMTIGATVRTIKCDIRTMKIGVQFTKIGEEGEETTYLAAIKKYIVSFNMQNWS